MTVLQSILNNPNNPFLKPTIESATIKIGLELLAKTDCTEDAIRRYSNHSAEIILTTLALLVANDDIDQSEIFEEISNLISVHDKLY